MGDDAIPNARVQSIATTLASTMRMRSSTRIVGLSQLGCGFLSWLVNDLLNLLHFPRVREVGLIGVFNSEISSHSWVESLMIVA